jgi:hypothetical protein
VPPGSAAAAVRRVCATSISRPTHNGDTCPRPTDRWTPRLQSARSSSARCEFRAVQCCLEQFRTAGPRYELLYTACPQARWSHRAPARGVVVPGGCRRGQRARAVPRAGHRRPVVRQVRAIIIAPLCLCLG